jgi:hypothetical protein
MRDEIDVVNHSVEQLTQSLFILNPLSIILAFVALLPHRLWLRVA